MIYYKLLSISGDINASLPLIEQSIQSGLRLGALGVMICDWVGSYPLQSVSSSLLPFTATAAMAWNATVTKVTCHHKLYIVFEVTCLANCVLSAIQVATKLSLMC